MNILCKRSYQCKEPKTYTLPRPIGLPCNQEKKLVSFATLSPVFPLTNHTYNYGSCDNNMD